MESSLALGRERFLKTKETAGIEYSHEDERVWAAQFRELKVRYRAEDELQDLSVPGKIQLQDLVDLKHGAGGTVDLPGTIVEDIELSEEIGSERDDGNSVLTEMSSAELGLFKRCKETSKITA